MFPSLLLLSCESSVSVTENSDRKKQQQHTDYRRLIYKVQALSEKLNFNFKQYGSFFNDSVDENIFHYYGKNSTKQFIMGQHIRFVLKLFCIPSSEEYLLHEEPYCKVDTDLPLVWVRVQIMCWV